MPGHAARHTAFKELSIEEILLDDRVQWSPVVEVEIPPEDAPVDEAL